MLKKTALMIILLSTLTCTGCAAVAGSLLGNSGLIGHTGLSGATGGILGVVSGAEDAAAAAHNAAAFAQAQQAMKNAAAIQAAQTAALKNTPAPAK